MSRLFFAEPIQAAGGVLVAPEGYLRRMFKVCRDNDILFVADEVVTGFGRLGHWFASDDVFGIRPDMIACAKGITSGYVPLGALIFSDEIYDVIGERGHERCFSHGFTYSGHPVACAAALENIRIIEEDGILDNVRSIGPYFIERLMELVDLPMVGDVRGHHLMAVVEIVADKRTQEKFPSAVGISDRINRAAMKRGMIMRPIDNLMALSPPLVVTKADVDFIVDTLADSIGEVASEIQATST